MKFCSINYILLIIVMTFSACVSDSSGTQEKKGINNNINQANTKEVTESTPVAATDQVVTTSSSKAKPLSKKAQTNTTAQDAMIVDANEKQNIIDNARGELAELEASKGKISPEDYKMKKSSIQEMIDNPEKYIPKKKSIPIKRNSLPNACELLTENFIAKTIGIEVAAITIKDGTNSASEHAKACFFRWDHDGIPNSGVLIQVQENPLPEEIDDWAAYYIQAKINQGETNPNTMQSTRFKPYKDLGVSGAYNYDMHRYLWRTEDDIVFMIALNLRGSESEEKAWVKKLGTEAMKNYI
jgi:hypothetical protein